MAKDLKETPKKIKEYNSDQSSPSGAEKAQIVFIWIVFQVFFRLQCLILDILTIPGSLTNAICQKIGKATDNEKLRHFGYMTNALWHLEFICRLCPSARKNTRDPYRNGFCVWQHQWRQGNYDIPPDFGFKNYLRQYYDGETDLKDYEFLYPGNEKCASCVDGKED